MKKIALIIAIILWAASAHAANSWYVDSTAAGSNNGTSWANAWKALSNITGVQPGDTVYISGSTGGQTYSVSGWTPAGGTSGNPIIYKIGQDTGHNGTATFTCGSGAIPTATNTVISGDAGDGNRHFTASCTGGVQAHNNMRASYISFGDVDTLIYMAGAYSGVEVDHCSATAYNDRLVYIDISSCSGYGANKFHHNSFALSYHPGLGNVWQGSDGFQGNLSCTDYYDNFIYGVPDGRGINHGDSMQASGGGGIGTIYVRIYNNVIRDLGNYGFYFEAYAAPGIMRHIRIYNNVIEYTDINIKSGSTAAIAMGPSRDNTIWDDIVVANNTIADSGYGNGWGGLWKAGRPATITDCRIQNNLIVNAAEGYSDPAVTLSNNVRLVLSANNGHFISYTPLAKNNNYHLNSADTSFKDQGVSLSSYFTTDKDGGDRPYGSAWDIGAYEFVTGVTQVKPMPPTSLIIN